jgi:hypothetical protein
MPVAKCFATFMTLHAMNASAFIRRDATILAGLAPGPIHPHLIMGKIAYFIPVKIAIPISLLHAIALYTSLCNLCGSAYGDGRENDGQKKYSFHSVIFK